MPEPAPVVEIAATVFVPDAGEANKALAADLLQSVFIAGAFDRLGEYFTPDYVQHNPLIGDGLDGLHTAGAELAKYHYLSVFKVLGQGDFVMTMSHVTYDGQDAAVYDLFRMAGGKIVEHWDVLQPIPPESEWKNSNGKF